MEDSKHNLFGWFSLIMSTLFICGAIGIAAGFTDHIEFIRENRILVAMPILLYGLLRLYRAIRALRGKKDMLNR